MMGVVDLLESIEGIENLELFEGFLCPGFVNTHCHLELSHMLGKLPEQTGLPDFIAQVPKQRGASAECIQEAISAADKQMQANGIVAVGDISNFSDTFTLKSESPIHYHTFIELFTIDAQKAEAVFQQGLELKRQCQTPSSIVPHATYSISNLLFEKINSTIRERSFVYITKKRVQKMLFLKKELERFTNSSKHLEH